MSNLLNKYNTFYFIASSLATLTLLTSLALINVPSSLILALAALSALALMILYKIIIDTKKVGKEFAHKERELEKKITLAANKEIGILKNQLRELTQEKYNLYEEAEKFSNKVSELEVDRESLLKEKKSLRERLEEESNLRSEMTNESRKIEKKIGELNTEQKELCHKVLYLCEQLREKEESCKKIKKEFKGKLTLSSKIEELHREKDALNKELSEQWYRIREITKENKYLSEELNKKSEELDKANGLIEDQFSELDRIREDCDNKVKNLKNLLSKRDANAEQLEPKPSSLLCEQSVFKILNEELVRCNS